MRRRSNFSHFATYWLGTPPLTKMDEISENFQTASDPPALVSENYVALFSGGAKICNEIFRIGVSPPPLFPENSSFFFGRC